MRTAASTWSEVTMYPGPIRALVVPVRPAAFAGSRTPLATAWHRSATLRVVLALLHVRGSRRRTSTGRSWAATHSRRKLRSWRKVFRAMSCQSGYPTRTRCQDRHNPTPTPSQTDIRRQRPYRSTILTILNQRSSPRQRRRSPTSGRVGVGRPRCSPRYRPRPTLCRCRHSWSKRRRTPSRIRRPRSTRIRISIQVRVHPTAHLVLLDPPQSSTRTRPQASQCDGATHGGRASEDHHS